jgi:hypothetical protein
VILGRWIVAAALMTVTVAAKAQVPPPPSLPGQDELSGTLVRAIEGKDVAAYASLLSDTLTVFEDGKQIASSKGEWLDRFGKMLAADGVSFKVQPGFSSTGRLLFIEYFNSMASWGGTIPRHCCWSYDAVAYDIRDGKVAVIRRLRGGDQRLDARGFPEARPF